MRCQKPKELNKKVTAKTNQVQGKPPQKLNQLNGIHNQQAKVLKTSQSVNVNMHYECNPEISPQNAASVGDEGIQQENILEERGKTVLKAPMGPLSIGKASLNPFSRNISYEEENVQMSEEKIKKLPECIKKCSQVSKDGDCSKFILEVNDILKYLDMENKNDNYENRISNIIGEEQISDEKRKKIFIDTLNLLQQDQEKYVEAKNNFTRKISGQLDIMTKEKAIDKINISEVELKASQDKNLAILESKHREEALIWYEKERVLLLECLKKEMIKMYKNNNTNLSRKEIQEVSDYIETRIMNKE